MLVVYFQDAEAVHGLVRLIPPQSMAVRHCLHSALVIGEARSWPKRRLKSLACAALTMNLSEMPLTSAWPWAHKP